MSLQYDSLAQRVYVGQEKLYLLEEKTDEMTTIPYVGSTSYPIQLESSRLISSTTGLWAIDPHRRNAWKVPMVERSTFSLHHEKVNAVYDDDGMVWIGATDGVRLYDRRANVFHFTAVFSDTLRSLGGNVHQVLDHEQDHCYYISAFNFNKLVILDKVTGDRREISQIDGTPLTECSMVYEDRKHRLWVLSQRNIFVADPPHHQFKRFNVPREDSYSFMDMTEDAEGNYRFASLHYGVFRYKPATNEWKLFKEEDGLFAIRSTAMLSDPHSRTVWTGDYSFGLFRYQCDSAKFTYFGMNTQDTASLQSSLINDLAMDKTGNIWVATSSGGVSRFSSDTQSFQNIFDG